MFACNGRLLTTDFEEFTDSILIREDLRAASVFLPSVESAKSVVKIFVGSEPNAKNIQNSLDPDVT